MSANLASGLRVSRSVLFHLPFLFGKIGWTGAARLIANGQSKMAWIWIGLFSGLLMVMMLRDMLVVGICGTIGLMLLVTKSKEKTQVPIVKVRSAKRKTRSEMERDVAGFFNRR